MNSHQRRAARRKAERRTKARWDTIDARLANLQTRLEAELAKLGVKVPRWDLPPELPSMTAALDAAFARDAPALLEAVRVPMPEQSAGPSAAYREQKEHEMKVALRYRS